MEAQGSTRRRRAAGIAAGIGISGVVALGIALGGAGAGAVATREPPIVPLEPAGDETPPHLLSETGLYRSDGSIDPRNTPFVPQYPLWTDGAEKSRWIRLPEGARIDVSDIDAWDFPAGTRFWKEFAWGGRRVETRMLWRTHAGAWAFAAYVWREDQSDAELASQEGVPRAFEVAPGRRHSIPGRADCLACHGSAPAPVLGFSALQLSNDRDLLAPHAEPLVPGGSTLRVLVSEDRLAPPRPDLIASPPRIRETDPVARAALGYLSANCGGCHNARGPLARLGIDLMHEVGAALDAPEKGMRSTLDAPCRFDIPGAPPGRSRLVVPGAPERSAIVHRMRSRRPSTQMPPLGTSLEDTEAIELVERWIAGLGKPEGVAAVSRASP